MSRLNSRKKSKILQLINQGGSLNKIKGITGVGKTTIYYYMRKLKGKKIVPVKIIFSDIELIGEVVGLFAGDGQYFYDKKRWDRRIRIFFNSKEDVLIRYYLKSIKRLINKFPRVYLHKSVRIMEVKSKEFSNFILGYVSFGNKKVRTIQLKDKNLLKNKNFTIGFLRGLIDSDGYVRKGRKEIYFGSISKNLFTDFLKGLDFFKFDYKCYLQKRKGYQDFYKVRLTGNEVDRFIKLIKPLKRF